MLEGAVCQAEGDEGKEVGWSWASNMGCWATGYLWAGYLMAMGWLFDGYGLAMGWPWTGCGLVMDWLWAGYQLSIG